MQVHCMERLLARVFQRLEYHASHPKEEDVIARLHHAGRVKVVVIGGFVGPAERGKGPKAGREPRVEHVWVLAYGRAPAYLTSCHKLRLLGGGKAVTIVAVP